MQKSQKRLAAECVVAFWNDFVVDKPYQPVEKTTSKIVDKVAQRIRAEPDFLKKVEWYFSITNKYLDGKNEFGAPLTLLEFLRNATTLRALRSDHEWRVKNGV